MGNEGQKMRTVKIYIMGKVYEVPEGLTIMKAMEYAGYKFVRGVGCRGGFCGACATVYRIGNDYRLYAGLACQTTVQEEMYLVQIPFVPAEKPIYDVEKLRPTASTILMLFPEITRCVVCNTCTKSCPQELEVMDAIQALIRGDLVKSAELSFDCIACGICSIRCPAEINHYHVFQLVRRLYGKYMTKKPMHLEERVKEILEGKYDEELEKLAQLGIEKWQKLYQSRDIEK